MGLRADRAAVISSRAMNRSARCGLLAGLLALPSVAVAQSPAAPNLIAPRSGWCSLTATPTLRWRAERGANHVSICRDRECSAVVAEADVDGDSWAPPSPLARGVWFWRVRHGEVSSPVWSFTVTARPGTAEVIVPRCTDVDGDGFGDAFIDREFEHRRVSLLWGSRAGFARRRALPLATPPHAPRDYPAGHLTVAGDLDGDGYADLLWSSRNVPARGLARRGSSSEARTRAGAIVVFRGGPRGPSATPSVRLDAREGEFLFGSAAFPVGDVDGDGRIDVFASSVPSGVESHVGGFQLRRRLFAREGALVQDITDLRCDSGEPAFAAAGDVDGDGFADVLAGCNGSNEAPDSHPPPRARVYHGSPDGLARPEELDVGSLRSLGLAEVRLAALGDLDGDGYGDVLAAWHPESSNPAFTYASRGLIWRGSPLGMRGPEPIERPGSSNDDDPSDVFAIDAGTVGDIDRDGRDDAVVSVLYTTLGVYRGGSYDAPLLIARGEGAPVSFFGFHDVCGDVDGDGHADVLVGFTCTETDTESGDVCLTREYSLMRGGDDGLSPSRMQPVSN